MSKDLEPAAERARGRSGPLLLGKVLLWQALARVLRTSHTLLHRAHSGMYIRCTPILLRFVLPPGTARLLAERLVVELVARLLAERLVVELFVARLLAARLLSARPELRASPP